MDFIFTCVEKYLEKNKFNDFWTLIFQFEIHELTKELKFPWIKYLALCIKAGIMMKNMHVQDVTAKNYIIFFSIQPGLHDQHVLLSTNTHW